MNKIDWYFCQKFLLSSALVGLIFYTLFFLIGLLENASIALSVWDYLLGVGLNTFSFFYGFLPTILLMSFLFAFGSMAVKREIVALQALGYSFKSLLGTVLKGTLLILFIWSILMELAFPLLIAEAKKILTQNTTTQAISINGQWIRSNQLFIKIQTTDDESLFGITLYQLDNQGKLTHLYESKKGVWQNNTLTLLKPTLKQYKYTADNLGQATVLKQTEIKQHSLPHQDFTIDLDFNTFASITLQPNEMHLSQLLRYTHYIKQNQIDGGGEGKFVFAFWERLLMPLGIIGLILIVLPSMLGTPRVQRLGDKIFIGIIISLCYFIATELARNSNIYITLPNEFAAAFLPILLLVSGILICYRYN